MNDILGHRLERTIFTHSVLHEQARSTLKEGEADGDKAKLMNAVILAAFSFEAYLNFAGEELVSFWNEIERIPAENKLRVICAHAKFAPDLGTRPYQSLKALWRFRNFMAHAHTESLTEVRDGPPPQTIEYPSTDWERECTPDAARRLVEDVYAIMKDLHQRAALTAGAPGQTELLGGEILRRRPGSPGVDGSGSSGTRSG